MTATLHTVPSVDGAVLNGGETTRSLVFYEDGQGVLISSIPEAFDTDMSETMVFALTSDSTPEDYEVADWMDLTVYRPANHEAAENDCLAAYPGR